MWVGRGVRCAGCGRGAAGAGDGAAGAERVPVGYGGVGAAAGRGGGGGRGRESAGGAAAAVRAGDRERGVGVCTAAGVRACLVHARTEGGIGCHGRLVRPRCVPCALCAFTPRCQAVRGFERFRSLPPRYSVVQVRLTHAQATALADRAVFHCMPHMHAGSDADEAILGGRDAFTALGFSNAVWALGTLGIKRSCSFTDVPACAATPEGPDPVPEGSDPVRNPVGGGAAGESSMAHSPELAVVQAGDGDLGAVDGVGGGSRAASSPGAGGAGAGGGAVEGDAAERDPLARGVSEFLAQPAPAADAAVEAAVHEHEIPIRPLLAAYRRLLPDASVAELVSSCTGLSKLGVRVTTPPPPSPLALPVDTSVGGIRSGVGRPQHVHRAPSRMLPHCRGEAACLHRTRIRPSVFGSRSRAVSMATTAVRAGYDVNRQAATLSGACVQVTLPATEQALLLSCIARHVADFTAIEIAAVLMACSRLGIPWGVQQDALLATFVMHAAIDARRGGGAELDVEAAAARVPPQATANVAWAAARGRGFVFDEYDKGAFKRVLERSVPRLNAQEVANVMWALGVGGHQAEGRLARLLQTAVRDTAGMLGTQELACVCGGLAKTGLRLDLSLAGDEGSVWESEGPSPGGRKGGVAVAEELQLAIEQLWGEFTPQTAAHVAWAVAESRCVLTRPGALRALRGALARTAPAASEPMEAAVMLHSAAAQTAAAATQAPLLDPQGQLLRRLCAAVCRTAAAAPPVAVLCSLRALQRLAELPAAGNGGMAAALQPGGAAALAAAQLREGVARHAATLDWRNGVDAAEALVALGESVPEELVASMCDSEDSSTEGDRGGAPSEQEVFVMDEVEVAATVASDA